MKAPYFERKIDDELDRWANDKSIGNDVYPLYAISNILR
jgi:hypothetical protein